MGELCIQPKIYFSSTVPIVKTSDGFQWNPFEVLEFAYYGSNCTNLAQSEVMIAEKGHYLSVDGGFSYQ